DAVATDLSAGMLRHAREGNERTGLDVPLVQANAEYLPLASGSFDAACSAFGAIPFVASVDAVFAEVHRVLRPGAPWVFSVTHPMRWIFPDDPGPQGLTVTPPFAAPPAGCGPLVVGPGALRAGALLTHVVHAPGSWPALWGPLEIWDLTAVPADSGAAGLAALLGAWRDRLRGTRPEPDSGCS